MTAIVVEFPRGKGRRIGCVLRTLVPVAHGSRGFRPPRSAPAIARGAKSRELIGASVAYLLYPT